MTTDREKINRLLTWSNTVQIFVFRNKSYFFICLLFPLFLSEVFCLICFHHMEGLSVIGSSISRPEVNDIKFQIWYL